MSSNDSFCHSETASSGKRGSKIVRKGYATSCHPAGFAKSTATEAAVAHRRGARCAQRRGRDASKPMFTRKNPQSTTTARTIIPKKKDPCVFTHTTNKNGNRENHRRSRERPRCRIRSSHASSVYPKTWGRIARPTV